MNSLGKFAFIPPFPLKIQCWRGARQNFSLKYNGGAEKGGIFPLKYNASAEKGGVFPLKYNAGTDKGGVFPRAGF